MTRVRRTVIAWSLVATPGEQCVLWDLDERVGVDQPWGLHLDQVAAIQAAVTTLNARPMPKSRVSQTTVFGAQRPMLRTLHD